MLQFYKISVAVLQILMFYLRLLMNSVGETPVIFWKCLHAVVRSWYPALLNTFCKSAS